MAAALGIVVGVGCGQGDRQMDADASARSGAARAESKSQASEPEASKTGASESGEPNSGESAAGAAKPPAPESGETAPGQPERVLPKASPIGEETMKPAAVSLDGLNALVASDGHVFVDLAGRPIPIGASHQPAFRPELARGLGKPTRSSQIEAIAASEDGTPSWLVLRDEVGRSYPNVQVLEHDGKRWRNKTRKIGPLVAYPSHLLRAGETIFGLRAYHADPAPRMKLARFIYDGGFTNAKAEARAEAFHKRVQAALQDNPRAFEVVAGPEAPLPALPAQWRIQDVVATADGTIFAMTERDFKSSEPRRVVQWSPGATEAEVTALPDLPHDARQHDFRMNAAGSFVVVSGAVGPYSGRWVYLAIATEGAWATVPALEQLKEVSDRGTFSKPPVAIGPKGELRLISGNALWRRSPEGAWARVVLPAVDTDALKPTRPGAAFVPVSIAWGSGAWWAVGHEPEDLYDVQDASVEAVFTSAPVTAVTELPRVSSLPGR